MIVKNISPIRILLSIYKLARKKLPDHLNKRGRKGYKLPTRIAIIAFLVIYKLTLERAEEELKETGLYKRLGAKKAPDYTTICKWRKTHANLVRLLIREAFYKLNNFKKIDKLTAIADGSGFKNHKYSTYYVERTEKQRQKDRKKNKKKDSKRGKKRRKKREFTRVVVTYAPEIDAIFEITATPSSVGEKTALMNGHLEDILESKIFKRFLGDKLFDSKDLVEALELGGIEACIPSRGGKLKPRDGARARANKNYERLKEEVGNLRSLVESCISSLKAFYTDYVRSRRYEGKETEIVTLGLIYNVARLCALSLI